MKLSQEKLNKLITEDRFIDCYNALKWLLDMGVDPSAENNYAIRWAYNRGHYKIVKLLLKDDRVDPSADNNLAIKWASYYGYLKIVKLLLKDKRVDPSAYNNYAIRWASRNGHLKVVELLKKWCIDNGKELNLRVCGFDINAY